MFTFQEKREDSDQIDPRISFANSVCKMIWQDGIETDDCAKEVQDIYNHFEENVSNIYQFISSDIPLFAMYELLFLGAENWGFSIEEWDGALDRAKKACELYYSL